MLKVLLDGCPGFLRRPFPDVEDSPGDGAVTAGITVVGG
jgi:hypothetical protein